jgi:hypothetical protein
LSGKTIRWVLSTESPCLCVLGQGEREREREREITGG